MCLILKAKFGDDPLAILSSRSPWWPKKLGYKFNISRTKKLWRWDKFFIIFKGLSVARNCLRHKNGPLKKGLLWGFQKKTKSIPIILQWWLYKNSRN